MEQNKLLNGLQTAFINQEIESDPYWRPKFVYNDYLNGKKVLSDINSELETCDEFIFSVAFITDAGLEPLLMTLKELEKRNIKGKILTTNYLHFTNPSAIKKLNSLNNIELKMYFVDNESSVGFHTKGYIFKHGDNFHIITGSSNLTKNAISKNEEWNTKIVCNKYGEYAQEILEEFSHLWNSDKALKLSNSLLDKYTIDFNKRSFIRNKYEYEYGEIIDKKIVANKMQKEFVNNIKLMISEGEKRALLISATGTGKTYASAFAIEQIKPKKVLFLVHREQIIDQAIISYKRILGDKITMGKVTGGNKNFKEDITFATVQTLSKDYYLKQLSKSAFDFIIIDEVHRAGADSYQKIMNYFTPNFYLGMSASPERTDKFNIYKLFDYNIACEIRLQQALEEDFLCPFHYFGITDILIDGETVDDLTELRNFNLLVSDERVKHIISSAEYYGYSGNRVKGLVFCRSRKEGKELSLKMNKCINNNNGKFYSTIFLSGENSQEERERAIERLTEDNRSDTLDYIFTVDIFNEGVDIPQINQVILLRPTQSPVVFIQQLGRGLRKFDNKDFVVVLDFIGNYTNNFMIPIALSGNRTNNKDDIRRYVQEGERIIPGESTIHFDYISRQNIFSSIDRASFNSISYLKEK
ncbi:MAG: DEAD/DEAH box helicase family protein, partial [Bacilli bacterium]